MNAHVKINQEKQKQDWWRGATIYQIYPRSFQDSNGDGIGDLKGITKRLSYIKDLGVDAIWISPFFVSPMKDYGYDVSDYLDVDPMFGSLSDFDEMLKSAHDLGLKIMIDLVLSHTSDQHEWFKESRLSRDNDKADWYVWADPKPDGTPPNNWLSIFGGSAWQWDGKRMQYYLHNFLTSQPDLNLHNEEVQKALLDVTKFWLERGVDGFRLDTINFYFHDKALRDNPALPPEKRNDTIAPAVNPYNHQDHLYDKNQPENIGFLNRFRTLLDQYDARTALGEVGDAQYGMEIMGEYTKGDDRVHMCYAFEFLSQEPLTAERVVEVLEKLEQEAPEGWPCWAFSNHDVVRHASRWNLNADQQRLIASLLLSLRGSICLYQGEELGLPEADVAFEDLQDPYGIEFWPEFKGRDGCRTPMVWQNDNSYGGFSTVKPWLPVSNEHLQLAADQQENDLNSMLNFYKTMIALRNENPALIGGQLKSLIHKDGILSFIRDDGEGQILCLFNFNNATSKVELPSGKWQALNKDDDSTQGNSTHGDCKLDMLGHSAYFYKAI